MLTECSEKKLFFFLFCCKPIADSLYITEIHENIFVDIYKRITDPVCITENESFFVN